MKLTRYVTLCLLCLVYQAVSDHCPYGWLENANTSSCYYVSILIISSVPLSSVADRCRWMDSEMMTSYTQNEIQWLTREISKLYNGETGYWLGYASRDSNITLTDGSNIASLIQNSSSADKGNEACLFFGKTLHLVKDCNQERGYICRRKIGLPMKCEYGWNYIQGSCFAYILNPAPWELAKENCKSLYGASLANLQTLELIRYARDYARMWKLNSWIGFSFNSKDNQFQWTDGSPVTQLWWKNSEFPYRGKNNSGTCGIISGSWELTSAWTTVDCLGSHTYACMKPSWVCPEGWNTIEDICFKLFVEPALTWIQARDYCNEMGTQLLKIKSQTIQDEVLLTARPLADELGYFWIGISDETGNFTWSDGTVSNFTFWAEDPHKNYKGNRRGYISMGDKTGRWRTESESMQRSFGCSMSRNSSNTDVTSHSIFICERGWTRSGNSCISSEQDKKSWPEANSTCNNLQSQLLNINSDTYLGMFSYDNRYWVNKDIADKKDHPNVNNLWSYQVKGTCPLLKHTESEIQILASGCYNTNSFYCEKPPVISNDYYLTTGYDADCGMMWEKRPGTDLCYQFRQAKMTWPHALQHCIDQNSSLASITTSEEQKYIEGRLGYLHFLQFWMGASDRREMFNIQWEDGNPFIYSNWDQGKPEFRNVPNCIGINADSMRWNDYSCYLNIGFICKKKASSSHVTTISPTSTSSVLPSNIYYGCPSGWHMYESNCYQINTQDEQFHDAMMGCTAQNSTLASISSRQENGFLWSILVPDKRYWIGSFSTNNQWDFVWSDSTIVKFDNFEFSPTPERSGLFYLSQIDQQTGEWHSMENDDIADGYICKKPQVIVSSPPVKHHSPGCMEDGYAYSEYCYTYYMEPTSWGDAEKFCRQRNGKLAVVSDSVTNDFLFSRFGSIKDNFWIGLSVVKSERNWVREIPPSEEFWEREFTGNDDGCACMTYLRWRLVECTTLFPFVCETERQGFLPRTVPTTTRSVTSELAVCPSTWMYSGGLCYKIFKLDMSWHEARFHCESLGGNLASIHDESTNTFIASLILDEKQSVWIGLHDTNIEKAFVWSDGSHLDFSRWSKSEPSSESILEDCVEIYNNGKWYDMNCHNKVPFVCSMNSGSATMPAPISTTPAPRCLESDWIYHNGFCYFFGEELKTWLVAKSDCRHKGGELTSIMSEDENNFLTIQLSKRDRTDNVWIGYGKIYQKTWSDGNPKTFDLILDTQKNNLYLNCVSLDAESGRWYTLSCHYQLRYICKKINETIATTPLPTNRRILKYCPYPFVGSAKIDKCFMVEGVSTKRNNWVDSKWLCSIFTATLGIINNEQEQEVVNTLVSKLKVGVWIGLVGEYGYRQSFTWFDSSSVVYTKWSTGYPDIKVAKRHKGFGPRNYDFSRPGLPYNGTDYSPTCVRLTSGQEVASWENTDCHNRYAYLCQRSVIHEAVKIKESSTSQTSPNTGVNANFSTFLSNVTTSFRDSVYNQSSTDFGSVSVIHSLSEKTISGHSLTKTQTALIVIGLFVLVGGIALVVVVLVRVKRQRAQSPIQTLKNEGGFCNVLYSAIHEPEISDIVQNV